MPWMMLLAFLIAGGLLVYLAVALLYPEILS